MTKNDLIKLFAHWNDGGTEDLKAADRLVEVRMVRHAMFFLHLSLEKKFKAAIVKKTKQHPPFTHNLLILAGRLGAEFNEAEIKWLEQLNQFNTSGRYPDQNELPKKLLKKDYLGWKKIYLHFLKVIAAD